MTQYNRQEALERIAAAVAAAFAPLDDPGVSDLYDEQSMSIHLPLGILRAARSARYGQRPASAHLDQSGDKS